MNTKLKNLLKVYADKFVAGEIDSFPLSDYHLIPYFGQNGRMTTYDIRKQEDMDRYLNSLVGVFSELTPDEFITTFIVKKYRIRFCELLINELENPEDTFLKAYTSSEFLSEEYTSIKNIYKIIEKKNIMTKEELKVVEKLPKRVRIFRSHNINFNVNESLSWTTDIEVAKWFKQRFKSNDLKVLTALVPKSTIWFYTNERNEKEVVLKPGTDIDKYLVKEVLHESI